MGHGDRVLMHAHEISPAWLLASLGRLQPCACPQVLTNLPGSGQRVEGWAKALESVCSSGHTLPRPAGEVVTRPTDPWGNLGRTTPGRTQTLLC